MSAVAYPTRVIKVTPFMAPYAIEAAHALGAQIAGFRRASPNYLEMTVAGSNVPPGEGDLGILVRQIGDVVVEVSWYDPWRKSA